MLKKKKSKKIIYIVLGLVALFFVGLITVNFIKHSPFLFGLLFKKEIVLKKTDDHINVLILGIGGGRHEGPNLTDTIILANLDTEKDKVTLTSIPRDLWIPDLESANKKINGAYSQGEDKEKDGGISLSKAVVRKVIGQDINYVVVIDFSGFTKAVDLLGGLDMEVDKSFDDYQYPLTGKEDDACGHSDDDIKEFTATTSAEADLAQFFPCRYKHLHFDKGKIHIDGQTALEFVRSRHGNNGEGSDFARSKRQEKVIKAFKDKVFSLRTLADPGKVLNLYGTVKDSIHTDIKEHEFDDFVRLSQKFKQAKIKSAVVDAGDEATGRPGLLMYAPISEDYDFLSVLIPRIGNGNFLEIQKYEECEIKSDNCIISKTPTQ